jgi:thiamine biosynthesis lipoprotein
MKHLEFKAMGSRMAVFLDRDGLFAQSLLDEVPGWFKEWEQILSRFRPDSDLSRLNAANGAPVQVHPVLLEVIETAIHAANWTGGLVTPTLLRSLERAGYAQTFEILHAAPNIFPGGAPDRLLEPTDWQQIGIDTSSRTVFLPAGMRLDLGGIGKGWAAHQAMLRLEIMGPVLVDASGDLAVSGLRTDGSLWPVAISDPLHVQENLGTLVLDRCGVATSGIDYHRWLKNGAWKHHIIDPRTAEPAQTDLLSVTVVAPDALQAEAAAKTILILGSQDGLNWLDQQPGCAALLAFPDGRVLYSHALPDFLWR